MWAWGLAALTEPDVVEDNIDIESFIDRISRQNSTTYFHNLKFDGHFIIDWLLNHGYKHIQDRGGNPGTFQTLISDMGRFYSITVRWDNGFNTEFRDSLNKLPMTLKRVALAFNLEEGKGEIDYDAPRPIGHQLTWKERDYLRRDVSILAHAMKQVIEEGMTRLTVASDSLAEYKRIVDDDIFKRMFPVFNLEMDAEIRRAYRGGFTYADPRFSKRQVGAGIVLDVNSLYPYIMKSRLIPYGEPLFQEGKVIPTEDRPLTIFSVTFTAKIKPDHIPCIQIKGSSIFTGTEYLREIEHPTTLMVTNVDWSLYLEHYDIDVIEYGGGWRFKAVTGMFDDYINKWSTIKANSTGGLREIAKLHLNALYGKFATNPNVTSKIPILKDGKVKYVRGTPDTKNPVYTPAGVFITSWARDLTIRAAQQNYDSFAYADTDSLHLLRDVAPDAINVHPTELGAWKLEYKFDAAYYIRAKAYLERHRADCGCKECKDEPYPHYTNRVAGLPEAVSEKITFDDLIDGKVFHGKLTPKSVPGGVVLKDVPFQLKL